MARVILPAIFDSFSGTIADSRYYMLGSTQCVASYSARPAYTPSIKQDNIRKAWIIASGDFQVLKGFHQAELDSWVVEARRLESSLGRTVTAYQLYMAYFMAKYVSELSVDVEPRILSGGQGGFGLCRFGTGTYGISRPCQLYHFDNRSLREWLPIDRRPGYGRKSYGIGTFGTGR
ncbi:MAG: hypothetical protein OEZ36_14280 [Spirochaetota bacterium]|nr:hypothetical protein [Spirochaetota bacterium]